ncbi:MAG: DUF4007 family protein [Anaerolineae bacterium]|nr:DUF4007 family protein [Anaerolineae bacterium]
MNQVISAIAEMPQSSSLEKALRERTALGTRYVKSMPRYAIGTGLLGFDRQLTPFGRYALAHDPMLEQPGTQWLMHYYLSAPHGPGPAFWHDLVASDFYVGREFGADQIARHIAAFLEQTEGRTLVERTVRSTATVFLGTYTKPDGLGKLGIVTALDGQHYRVTEPVSPPVWAVAYALLDYWAAHYEERLTVSLDSLTEPGGFISLFLMGQQEFGEVLRTLQAEHYVEVYRTAPPYQVVLLRCDSEHLLKKLYGTQ